MKGKPECNPPICVLAPGSSIMLASAFDNRQAVVQRIEEVYISKLEQDERKELYRLINRSVTNGNDKYVSVGNIILCHAPAEGSA